MTPTVARLVRMVLPPCLLLLLVGCAWEAWVVAFKVPPFLLPRPTAVLTALGDEFPKYARATWITASAALSGLALSILVGTLTALLFSQSRVIRSSCYPYAIFLQTVPVIAVAPLIINWFGDGFLSITLVAFILSLFPIISNATAGMLDVDPDLVDLFRIHNASRWQVLFKLRVPNAIPALITGVRTSCGLAVIGAIVGEFFAAFEQGQQGLGSLIRQLANLLRTDELFAAVFASTFLGVAIFAVVSVCGEMILSRWYDRSRNNHTHSR